MVRCKFYFQIRRYKKKFYNQCFSNYLHVAKANFRWYWSQDSKRACKNQDRTGKKIQSNIRVVKQALETLNTGDLSRIHEFISPQYFNHESQVDPIRSKLRGPEEFMDTVKNLRNAFPDLHYEEQETAVSGDKVISVLTVTGKHMGNFFVIPPTGREISYRAVHIHRIGNDGK